eukprot:5748455-Pyramimonas_sp.AAC.1
MARQGVLFLSADMVGHGEVAHRTGQTPPRGGAGGGTDGPGRIREGALRDDSRKNADPIGYGVDSAHGEGQEGPAE